MFLNGSAETLPRRLALQKKQQINDDYQNYQPSQSGYGSEAAADITAGASVQEPLLSANGFSLSAEDGCRRGQFPRPAGSQEPAGR